jgi:hypothetical protein
MSKSLKHAIEFAGPSETKEREASMSQRDRFIRTARELGCDEDPEAFKRAVRKLAKAPPAPRKRARDSDDEKPS